MNNGSIARIRGWLLMPGEQVRQLQLAGNLGPEVTSAINGLSLAALEGFLGDRDLLQSIRVAGGEEQAYPLRSPVGLELWTRYAELAPKSAAAMAFANGEPATEVSIEGVLEGISKSDPEEAFRLWMSSDASNKDDFTDLYMLQPVMTNWAMRDPGAFGDRLKTFPRFARHSAWSAYVQTLGATTDWESQVAKFHELFSEAEDGAATLQSLGGRLISHWAAYDPDAAFRWMEILNPTRQTECYSQTIYQWMKADPVQASGWLRNWTPPAESSDAFFGRLLATWANDEPDVAEAVLSLIREPAKRDELVLTSNITTQQVSLRFSKSEYLSRTTQEEIKAMIRQSTSE